MEKEYCIITTACNKKEIADKIVEKEILKIHDYETCEIISYDITNGNEKFLKWIEEETK